ncbi:unnamed protein product [Rhizophagus irregularis]|nr:unnamed protein product [Rhizophagus irregularis]
MARWGMSSIVVLLPEELSTRFNGCPMEMIGYWHDDASQEQIVLILQSHILYLSKLFRGPGYILAKIKYNSGQN